MSFMPMALVQYTLSISVGAIIQLRNDHKGTQDTISNMKCLSSADSATLNTVA